MTVTSRPLRSRQTRAHANALIQLEAGKRQVPALRCGDKVQELAVTILFYNPPGQILPAPRQAFVRDVDSVFGFPDKKVPFPEFRHDREQALSCNERAADLSQFRDGAGRADRTFSGPLL